MKKELTVRNYGERDPALVPDPPKERDRLLVTGKNMISRMGSFLKTGSFP